MWSRISAALWLLALSLVLPAHATTVLPATLDDLVGGAAAVFEGTCISNRTERDPRSGMAVTYTTFLVKDTLKGSVGMTHVIKQIGGDLSSEGGPNFRVPGVPTFEPNQDYVVFMAGVSGSGFSSPIGLQQGRFSIVTDESGAKKVGNGRDFGDLTAGMPADQLPAGLMTELRTSNRVPAMDLDAFKDLVRRRALVAQAPRRDQQ
jgi:hypothetical protein